MIEIEQISCSDIYPILKSYQRNIIEKLVSAYGIEKAAELWITSKGPIQTARFGGVSCDSDNSKSYWKRIKNEFDKLVCGSSEYTEEQKEVSNNRKIYWDRMYGFFCQLLISINWIVLFHISSYTFITFMLSIQNRVKGVLF